MGRSLPGSATGLGGSGETWFDRCPSFLPWEPTRHMVLAASPDNQATWFWPRPSFVSLVYPRLSFRNTWYTLLQSTNKLLALYIIRTGAHSRGVFRDFHPIPLRGPNMSKYVDVIQIRCLICMSRYFVILWCKLKQTFVISNAINIHVVPNKCFISVKRFSYATFNNLEPPGSK